LSDTFQAIVDVDASEAASEELAARVLDWLWAEGIVSREKSDNVLGADAGYGPGDRLAAWVPEGDDESFRGRWTNGLEVSTSAGVYVAPGEDEVGECPRGHRQPLPEEWGEIMAAWLDNPDAAVVICTTCEAEYPLAEWHLAPLLAVGNLAFTFWNWPPLGDRMVAEVRRLLAPHRIELIAGKL